MATWEQERDRPGDRQDDIDRFIDEYRIFIKRRGKRAYGRWFDAFVLEPTLRGERPTYAQRADDLAKLNKRSLQ